MKILYINSTHSDYLQDILYSGLVKILGTRSVKTVPWNKQYLLPVKQYPKNLGYQSGETLQYILSCILPFRYDCVIVAAAKPDAFKTYIQIAPSIPSHIPVIFIDGGDFSNVGCDLERKNCYELYEQALAIREFNIIFKREKLIDTYYPSNVFACPFAFNLDTIKQIGSVSKTYDVSFWAVESDPIRTQALTLIADLFDCAQNGTTLNQTFKQYKRKGLFYLEELKRCKIVLNFRGRGWDTLRYWEVPALGVCMISQKPQIEIPNPFTHGANIIYCNDDLSNLIELCEYYLKHNDKREQIAQQSYNHIAAYHTDVKRATYVLSIIQKHV